MQLKAVYVSKGVAVIHVGDSRRKVLATPFYSTKKNVLGQDQQVTPPWSSAAACVIVPITVATLDSLSKIVPAAESIRGIW